MSWASAAARCATRCPGWPARSSWWTGRTRSGWSRRSRRTTRATSTTAAPLESMLAAAAAQSAPDERAASSADLDLLLERQRAAASLGDLAEVRLLDRRFHDTLYALAAMPASMGALDQLRAKSDRYIALYLSDSGRAHTSVDEHGAILDALRNGDPERSAALTRAHVLGGLCLLTGSLADQPAGCPTRTPVTPGIPPAPTRAPHHRRSEETPVYHLPEAIQRLSMPELTGQIGMSLRDAERELENAPAPPPRSTPPTPTPTASRRRSGRCPPSPRPRAGRHDVHALPGRPGRARGRRRERLHRAGRARDRPRRRDPHPGTQGALFTALAAILSPGDLVLLPDPDYLSTERMLRYFGAEVRRIPMIWPHEGAAGRGARPTLDLEALERAAAEKPRLMVFAPQQPHRRHLRRGDDRRHRRRRAPPRLRGHRGRAVLPSGVRRRDLPPPGRPGGHGRAHGDPPRPVQDRVAVRLPARRRGRPHRPRRRDGGRPVLHRPARPSYAQHLLARWIAEDGAFLERRLVEYEALRDATVKKINASSVLRVNPSYGTAYLFPEVLTGASDQAVALALKERAGVVVNPATSSGPGHRPYAAVLRAGGGRVGRRARPDHRGRGRAGARVRRRARVGGAVGNRSLDDHARYDHALRDRGGGGVRVAGLPLRTRLRHSTADTGELTQVVLRVVLADGGVGWAETGQRRVRHPPHDRGHRRGAGRAARHAGSCLGRPGTLAAALAERCPPAAMLLDVAVRDASARTLGVPLWATLRGPGRGPATSGGAADARAGRLRHPEQAGERASAAAESGFRRVKIRVGGDLEVDRAGWRGPAARWTVRPGPARSSWPPTPTAAGHRPPPSPPPAGSPTTACAGWNSPPRRAT
ncbi:aminotransferase class I/II-fold pyridoxal phosphate-dependent enzyme [Streptomyces sp. M19]